MRALLFLAVFTLVFSVKGAGQTSDRVQVSIVTDEADAVLGILKKKSTGQQITDQDWKKIFDSEGYRRLKERELSMKRPFDDSAFREFVLSESLYGRRKALTDTLAAWKKTNVVDVAYLPLAYLPANAVIRAKIYPVIKPRDNSFVFGLPNDPAIFLYLDPGESKEKFENTLAHELHHIGFGTACPDPKKEAAIKKMPIDSQRALRWIGAFGEGFAMLAAAGGPDIHPHAVSSAEDRARWDRDVKNFDQDLRQVESFLLDLANGKLDEKQETEKAYSFFGVQGPWYTVGWKMAVVIEKVYGRDRLIRSMCDQRELLSTFNSAARKYQQTGGESLAMWSKELIAKIT